MLPGDLLVTKRHHGAFARTELENLLKAHGVETVVICGVSTSVGVEATVRQGTGLGFAFVVAEDACGAMRWRSMSTRSRQFSRAWRRFAQRRK